MNVTVELAVLDLVLLGVGLAELIHRFFAAEVRNHLDLVDRGNYVHERDRLVVRVAAHVGHKEHERRVLPAVNGQAEEGQLL